MNEMYILLYGFVDNNVAGIFTMRGLPLTNCPINISALVISLIFTHMLTIIFAFMLSMPCKYICQILVS